MASEAITQNDLREILSRVTGSVPSEFKKLLWTNPSPTSAFSAQTVSLDLSNYDDVEVEFMCWNTEQQEMASVTVAIGASGRMVSPLAVCAFRKFSVTSTGVAFETAQAYPNYGNWALGTQNNACIPYRIYGIKYERVSPPQVEYPNYSTEEQQVGTWVTGKPLYRKVFQYASMPNNTTAVYAHNISNMDIAVRYTCCWWDSTDGRFLMHPRLDSSTIKIQCSINKTNIILEAVGTNWSTRTSNVNVIVEYTKTTD